MKKSTAPISILALLLIGLRLSAFTVVPGVTTLVAPENMEQQVSYTGSVFWNVDLDADQYQLLISSDLGFTNILVDSVVTDTSYLYLGQLNPSTTYFWKVRGKNTCGDGVYSETWRFTIGKIAETCLKVSYTSDPFPILDNDTVNIALNFSALGWVTSVHVVQIEIDHPSISDVVVQLIHPTGQEVLLVENICTSNSGMNLGFKDETNSIIPCPPTTGDCYEPVEPLADFSETNSKGQWKLWVADQVQMNEGWMNTWTLEVCFTRAADDCTPMEDLNGSVATGTYHYANELSSAGSMQSNAMIVFKAGNAININENFKTGNNTVLELKIEDCEEDF